MTGDDLRLSLASDDPAQRAAARKRVREAWKASGADLDLAAEELDLDPAEVLQWSSVAELPSSRSGPPGAASPPGPSRLSFDEPPGATPSRSPSLPSSVDLARASGSPFDDFRPEHQSSMATPMAPTGELEAEALPRQGSTNRPSAAPESSLPEISLPEISLPEILAGPTVRPHTVSPTRVGLPGLSEHRSRQPRRVSFVLHAHLPWVLGHGTWPHGEDWLMEAVVHCYVPLVAMLRRLEAQGRRRILTFSVTPVLAAQLADPRTRIAVDKYYGERFAAAETLQKQHPLGSWWGLEIARSRADWNDISGDLISALRVLEDRGTIELSTCAATHAYLPLTHHTEMIRLQIAAGCRLHEKLFGRWPRGIWMPECAYRPSGPWRHPVTGASEPFRAGNEAFLEEQDLRWTVVDAHLILGGEPFLGYGFPWANDPHAVSEPLPEPEEGGPTLSQQLQPTRIGQSRVAALIREPHTARQVWARHLGYPGDPRFLDFHKRHETSGLRLWSVTDADANLADKLPYWPHAAADAIQDQARHFLDMLQRIPGLGGGVAVCPFDAELFGHWWYEGPQWLEAVFEAAAHESNLETTTPEVEVERIPPHRRHELLEGSWGEEGDHRVWVNPQTEWMWKDLRDAEVAVDRLLADAASSATLCEAALAQLMLMASSDWPFLITMKAAADYATTRFKRHRDRLYSLLNLGTSDPLPDWVDEDLALMDLDRRWWSQERI